LSAVRGFFRFLVQERRQPCDPAELLEGPRLLRKLPDILNRDEVLRLLEAPTGSKPNRVRDRAMLHLCFSAALRVSELVEMPMDAIRLAQESSVHILGKGRRERCLPLWKEAAADLRAWLAVRGQVSAPELFVNARGANLTRSGFEYILAKHVKAAAQYCNTLQDRTVSPHQLRHSCALLMLQATRDIRKVALWLDHADVKTTEVYLRIDPTEKPEAVEAVLPPALRRGRFRAPDALIASLLDPG